MIQEKLGLNGALKNTLPRLKYIQEMFGKVKLVNNEDLESFNRGKKSN